MSSTRRAHKKSRNGCFTCKSRRIKCDESHPSCANCKKKKLLCEYPPEIRFVPQKKEMFTNISIDQTNETDAATVVSKPDKPRKSKENGKHRSSADHTHINNANSNNITFVEPVAKNPPVSKEEVHESLIPPMLPSPETAISRSNQDKRVLDSFISHMSGGHKESFAAYPSEAMPLATDSVTFAPSLSTSNLNNLANDENIVVFSKYSKLTLDLIHYSINDLFLIISKDPLEQNIWYSHIHTYFFTNKCFQDIVIALSALYKYYQDTRNTEMLNISRSYYNEFFRGYSNDLMLSGPDILSMDLSLVLSIYLSASIDFKLIDSNFYRIGGGMQSIFSEVRARLPDAHPMEVLKKYRVYYYNQFEGSNFPPYLRELFTIMPFETILECCDEEETVDMMTHTPIQFGKLKYRATYDLMMNALFNEYKFIYDSSNPDDDPTPIVLRWSISPNREFMKLLDSKDPRSLIIVLHLLKLLISLDSVWFKKACYGEITHIQSLLPSGWNRWLQIKLASS